MPRPGEPLWLDDDQDKVNAYLQMERTICSRCGTTEGDWINPTTKRYLEPPKWEAEHLRCFGCAELESAQQEIPAREKGIRVVLVPFRDDPEDRDDDGLDDEDSG